MDQSEYTIESFLLDESFQSWVDHSNEADHEYWEDWLQENPDKHQLVEAAAKLYKSLKLKGIDVSTEKIEASLRQVKEVAEIDKNKEVPFWRSKIYRYAAVISLLILFAASVIYMDANELSRDQHDGMLTFIEKVTPKGQKSTITLSDGTVIKLNSDSKLKFPKSFSEDVREIYFEGEAFFDVSRDSSRPFIIKTNDLQINVIGTSFNVNSFDRENRVEVGVLTGKVSVHMISDDSGTTPETAILLPHEKGVFDKVNSKISKEKFDSGRDLAWKDGVILFREAEFDKVVERLERWYGFEFVTSQVKSMETKLTGRYEDKSLEFVLGGICYSLGISYEIDMENKIVTLTK